MKLIKNSRIIFLLKSYFKATDTITTKLLTLVLFTMVIPLFVIANSSTNIINQSMVDNAESEINFNATLAKEKYYDEINNLKLLTEQATKGFLNNTYINYLKTGDKKELLKNLDILQKNSDLSLCMLVDRNNRVISNTGKYRIARIKNNLSSINKDVFSGKTIITTEILTSKDFNFYTTKSSHSLFSLSQLVFTPVLDRKNHISATLIVGKSLDNNKPLSFLQSLTSVTLAIYKIDNNSSKIISSNLSLSGSNNTWQQINASIFNNDENYSFIKVLQPNGYELGKFEPLKNLKQEVIGAIYIGIPENKFKEPVWLNINYIFVISLISLFVAIFLAALFSRTITTPILKLVAAANSLASGQRNQNVKIRGNDEVAQLAKTFNQMASDLQKQEQLKDNFVATLTHDLKVPMLAENQTISYLLKEAYGPVTAEQTEVLELIKSTNNSSLEMVSTLLEVYRYETGNVQLMKTDFDLVKLAKESIKQINSLAEDKKITIFLDTTKEEVFINADEREIRRVLHNLISNAISNGIHRGHIYCNIVVINNDNEIYKPQSGFDKYTTLKNNLNVGNSVIVSIKDDGIGIAREDIPQLFKRFSLSKGRKPSGTGLGLCYSYQVITGHDGYIWAESIEGQGSTFKFTLPLGN